MATVNTNYSALVALQNLNASSKQLDEVQNRINTGLKVASAKDNGAVFAIAQALRSRVGALGAVSEGLDRTVTNLDTAQSAGGQVSDILKTLRETAERAKTFTSASDRASAQADFVAARDRIDAILNAATVNGVNLLNGTNVTNPLTVSTSDIGSNAAQTVQSVTGPAPNATYVTGLSTLSASTTITGGTSGAITSPTNTVQVATGDQLRFTLKDAAGNTTQTAVVTISNSSTLGALQSAISTATQGKVNLTFNGNKLNYDSDQNFSVNFLTGVATSASTATDLNGSTSANSRANFFTGVTGGYTSASTAGAAAATSDTSSGALQTGGGYQTATAALASGTNTGTLASSLLTGGATTSTVTFTTTVATGNTNAFTVNITAGQTLGQYLQAVSTATGGQVTAAYDANSRQIVYNSAVALDVVNGTGAAAFDAAAVTSTVSTVSRSASTSASAQITGYDFRVNGGSLASLASLDLTVDPSTASTTLSTLASTLNTALASLGAQGRALDIQKTFLTSLSDNIEKGVGLLVDADLAKESARLQSLQVKQQLGAQALSIANQSPQILLSFFR